MRYVTEYIDVIINLKYVNGIFQLLNWKILAVNAVVDQLVTLVMLSSMVQTDPLFDPAKTHPVGTLPTAYIGFIAIPY